MVISRGLRRRLVDREGERSTGETLDAGLALRARSNQPEVCCARYVGPRRPRGQSLESRRISYGREIE
jgi:hypothetical protein